MKKIMALIIIACFFITAAKSETDKLINNNNSSRDIDYEVWDGNQISTWHRNTGNIVDYHMTGNSGLEWPKGSGNTAVFQSGLWLAAGKINGVEEIRTAAAEYTSEYVPGNLGIPDSSQYRIYTIYSGDDPSNPDWVDWPVDQGAPWVDVDSNGVYDPYVDHPDIIGDMFQWYVMNDGDAAQHTLLWGTQPLDVEVRVSLFGFDHPGVMGNTLFIKFQIINSGLNQLDSMFVSLWSDPDLGDASDDLVGCDPEDNLGFCYNDFGGDVMYGDAPPVVGYVFLQTPIIPSPGDTAWVSGVAVPDFINVPISSFVMYIGGNPLYIDPRTSEEAYRYMNGLIGLTGDSYIDPTTGEPSTFVMNGDPVTGEGWVDSSSADKRFLMTVGPISMAPGDTQEIVGAIVLAQGLDNLSSITALRQGLVWVQLAYDTNFEVIGPSLLFSNHTVLPTTEDTIGPYHFEVILETLEGFELNESSPVIFYGIDSITNVAPLISEGGDLYSADLYGTGESGMFRYFFYAEDSEGNGTYFPDGAPTGFFEFEVGPDLIPPEVTGLLQLDNTLFPEGTEEVSVTVTDRFPVSVTLFSQISGGDIQSVALIEGGVTDVWIGTLTWSGGSPPGDTVSYWVEAVDQTINQNVGSSDILSFAIVSSYPIGNWDDWPYSWFPSNWEGSYGGSPGWHLLDLTSSGYDEAKVAYHSSPTIIDTLTLIEPINLSVFSDNTLTYRQAFSGVSAGTLVGYVEGRDSYGDWQILKTVIASGQVYVFEPDTIDLIEFASSYEFTLRFRSTYQEWMVDDIWWTVGEYVSVDESSVTFPKQFALHQNYPNPFNPMTTIKFDLPKEGDVVLVIYNILGREVEVLVSGRMVSGEHKVVWDASDIPSGIYFYRLVVEQDKVLRYKEAKKLVVLK